MLFIIIKPNNSLNFNISDIHYSNNNIEFIDTLKIILISKNFLLDIKNKIDYINQLFDYNNNINENIINLYCSYNNLKIIFNFTILDINNSIISNYFDNLNLKNENVSSFNTNNMPLILKNFLSDFSINNINSDVEYNKFIILNELKKDTDYLQYNLLYDIFEYQIADNYRIINKDILKIFLKRNTKYTNYDIDNIINNCMYL
jgi:hypothetical protein